MAPKTEQTLCCAGHRISNSCSPCKRIIEIPAVRHITGKVADEGFMQAVSETGYLVLVYQCRRRVVKFFFSLLSGFSMAVVWGAKS
jgi:hypothetical protein